MFNDNSNDYSSISHSTNSDTFSNTSNSRRQLFPSVEDDLDDFTYITPLGTSTSSSYLSVTPTDVEIDLACTEDILIFSKNAISDYIIIENIYDTTKKKIDVSNDMDNTILEKKIETPLNDKFRDQNKDVPMPPLHLSPAQIVPQLVVFSPKKTKPKSPDTNESQDCFGLNTIANRLIRNYSVENTPSAGIELGKRKMPFSSTSSLHTKQPKLDQTSKVRTELFPKGELSASNEKVNKKTSPKNDAQKHKNKSSIYLCARKGKKGKFGQINAGVGHKIRRPKPKKVSSELIIKSALKIMDNSVLNGYLKSVENFSAEFTKKQIQPLVNNVLVSNNNIEIVNTEHLSEVPNVPLIKKRTAESPLPDENKKFFKSHRSVSTVFIDEHLNFKFSKEKVNTGNVDGALKEFDIDLDVSDLVESEKENIISSETIENILGSLESTLEGKAFKNDSDKIILKAHNSVAMSENSIHLHVPSEIYNNTINSLVPKQIEQQSILLSPTSQMCNMTSGLVLNSPTRNQQITLTDFNLTNNTNLTTSSAHMQHEKLFPIFYGKQNLTPNSFKSAKNPVTRKIKRLPKNQLLLDAGQKKFGATECSECKFVYHMGDANDELLHLNYHNAANTFRFGGWKDERVVARSSNSRIIKIIPSDPKPWLKKLKDLLELVNRDLGYYEMPVSMDNAQAYLYIRKQVIVGCVIAEPKSIAYQLLSDNIGIDLCSEASFLVKCGVSRIWVSQTHRKGGIGTLLLNCLRGNFMYGHILSKTDIAFSSPTDAGKAFATKYFNTPNFLIYT